MELVLATHNVHKVREYRQLLKGFKELDVYSLNDFSDYRLPEETGSTFEENASLKALHAAQSLDRWVIADDSGLVVPALENSPGVFSARYAGIGASDLENRKKLLAELRSLSEEKRIGYFECCIALASKSGVFRVVRGICEGELLTEEKGRNGFGYDPIFRKYEYSKTFAELDEAVKNRISHRRKAFDKLQISLESLIFEDTCAT
jgi:XTP/dITP diphosphohydrolase